MSVKPSAVTTLLDSLTREWQVSTASEFADLWAEKLGTTASIKLSAPGSLEFWCAVAKIRLRGMHEVPFLLMGSSSQASVIVEEFLRKHNVPGRTPFLLFVTDNSAAAYPKREYGLRVIADSAQIRELLVASDSLAIMKQWLLRCVPKRSLIPYNQELAPEDNMFFGRERELDKLRRHDLISYAIAGPGRVGKTSLVKKYHRDLRGEAADASFYIDLQECGHKSSDGLASFIAFKIEQNKDAKRVDSADFVNFLRRMRSRKNRRLELILDEVDEVCQGPFFETLGEAAKHGFTRLLLCGKGRLLSEMQDTSSHLFGRLDLLHPEPLDQMAADALVLQPLADLGLRVLDPETLKRHASRLTGRHPHLLQFYGRKLAELCVDEASETVSEHHLDTLHFDYEIAQLFTSPLDGLPANARSIAIALLNALPNKITHSTVHSLAKALGLPSDFDDVRLITRELFINNVLAWSNLHYVIAYEALPDYAREMGLLLTPTLSDVSPGEARGVL